MNCVNHPEAAVTAFCQNCGKGLCAQCSREVQGNVFCEPCLAARVTGVPGPGAPGGIRQVRIRHRRWGRRILGRRRFSDLFLV
jgi:hypothetical protein